MIPANCSEVYDILVANRERLGDREWLIEFLRPHCKIKRMRWRGSRLRIIQFPSEFADWLLLMRARSVKRYLEIGTSTGGSFFMVDSYLRACFDDYQGSVGVDRTSKLRDFDLYQKRFPTCTFRHCSSENLVLGDVQFDAAFIDAFHVRRWVLRDYEKVRNNASLVGFHDIVLQGASVDRAWGRIKRRAKQSWEFIDTTAPPEARCGIGAVLTR